MIKTMDGISVMNKEYNQIVNLIKFNVNFSDFIGGSELLKQSPDYVLEKYNYCIGFEPIIEKKMYTSDEMADFFIKYWKRWSIFEEYSVNNILMYLYSTKNLNLLLMFNKFEEYIGPMSMISDNPYKRGLHHITENFVYELLEKNEGNLKTVLRDMKIGNII